MAKAVSSGGATPDMTYYFGPFVHEGVQSGSSSLKYIMTPEGRILNTGTDGTPVWEWEYYLKDHLGNVRVVIEPIDEEGKSAVQQENHYYPFGMLMSQLSSSANTTNDYLFSGKQLESNFDLGWYDFGGRGNYNSRLGVWHSVDRFAEKYLNFSTYQYAANNPIRFIDINGDSISATQNFTNDKSLSDVLAFILSCDVGYAYYAQFAAKGDKITIGDKTFSFDSDGAYSEKGINLSLDKMMSNDRYYGYYNGYADLTEKNGIFTISSVIDSRASLFDLAETTTHESFLEADYIAKDVMDGKRDYSNISKSIKQQYPDNPDYWGHFQNNLDRQNNQNHNLMSWPGAAFHVLREANSAFNISNPLTNQQIKDKMIAPPGLNGNITIK